MNKVNLSYFYHLGHYVNALALLHANTPLDLRGSILFPALNALRTFVADDSIFEVLPRSIKLAGQFLPVVEEWAAGKGKLDDLPYLHAWVGSFSVALSEEMEAGQYFVLTDKGNLSIDRLMLGASNGYPEDVLKLLDSNVTREIDEAGRCLACGLNTACGFHILRSVEIGLKGYLHAAAGSLPKSRNWGEYIKQLESAGASTDVIDIMRILKTKRNPLMHPQDSLDEAEAVDILCLCQAVTGALVKDIKGRSLETQFVASLALLPMI